MSVVKLKLKRVDPVKYAIISAMLTVLLMLIILVPFFLLFSVVGFAAADNLGPVAAMLGGSIFFVIFIPFIYGALVFIVTLILTFLLNFILKKTGGLDLDFEKTGLEISQIGD